MLNKIKNRFLGKEDTDGTAPVTVKRQGSFTEDYDRTMEAVALAEAGAQHLAQKVVMAGRSERPKILVVTMEDSFNECVMNYAIQLAERMKYEIIILNVHPLACLSDGVLSAYEKHLHEEFTKRAGEAGEVFEKKAASKGIVCRHVVKHGDLKKAVEVLHREAKRIDFVITAPEITQDEISRWTLPTFNIIC